MAFPSAGHPEFDAYIEYLRGLTPQERAAHAMEVIGAGIDEAWRQVRAAHPGLSKRELDVKFVEIHYGAELATKLRAHIEQRDRAKGSSSQDAGD